MKIMSVNIIITLNHIIAILAITAFANSAKCSRSLDAIICEKADRGVIRRLDIYYENDVSLIVKDSSISIFESGMLRRLKFLRKICFTKCGIRDIQDGAFSGVNLTHLNLARNSIRDIPKYIFANLTDLKYLDLSHNLILEFELTNGVGYHMPKISYVDVSNNRLKSFNLVGNFSDLETINFQNNKLREFQIDAITKLPKIKEVFFDGNSLNKSYENFVTFIFISSNLNIDSDESFFKDDWSLVVNNITRENLNNSNKFLNNSQRSIRRLGIEKEFQLSPELIKSLSPSQLTDLAERILTLRNFTIIERQILEKDRKLIQDESRSVKKEYKRIDQLIKRFEEVSGEAKQESVGEYIEESCERMPDDGWWKRFKKWKCKKLFNWVKRLISR